MWTKNVRTAYWGPLDNDYPFFLPFLFTLGPHSLFFLIHTHTDADKIPEGKKFNMVQMYEHIEGSDDIRAWRPIPNTQKVLNRGDLVAFTYTMNIIATPKAFGLFPVVTAVLVLKRASFNSASDNPTALGDEMGFLPYVAPEPSAAVPGEEAPETGASGFGESTNWSSGFGSTSPAHDMDNPANDDQPARKKHRADPGSVDVPMLSS